MTRFVLVCGLTLAAAAPVAAQPGESLGAARRAADAQAALIDLDSVRTLTLPLPRGGALAVFARGGGISRLVASPGPGVAEGPVEWYFRGGWMLLALAEGPPDRRFYFAGCEPLVPGAPLDPLRDRGRSLQETGYQMLRFAASGIDDYGDFAAGELEPLGWDLPADDGVLAGLPHGASTILDLLAERVGAHDWDGVLALAEPRHHDTQVRLFCMSADQYVRELLGAAAEPGPADGTA